MFVAVHLGGTPAQRSSVGLSMGPSLCINGASGPELNLLEHFPRGIASEPC